MAKNRTAQNANTTNCDYDRTDSTTGINATNKNQNKTENKSQNKTPNKVQNKTSNSYNRAGAENCDY